MANTISLENARLHLQLKLDEAKTHNERNILGQFATPTMLALDILRKAKSLFKDSPVSFLDPAIGTGSFYSALNEVFPINQIQNAVGYEIDEHYGLPAIELWKDNPLTIRIGDFTKQTPNPNELFNLIVCNPPYVRHHHIESKDKKRLKALASKTTNISLSGLSGLYCYFMCISHAWLDDGGVGIWLIPSEFMDVNYGQMIKKYLCNNVELLQLHRFNPADVQFDDALVSSAVVIFRKGIPDSNHKIQFTYGGTLESPSVTHKVLNSDLNVKSKWTNISLNGNNKPKESTVLLSDLFTIRRGIATGANKFFILPVADAESRGIPLEYTQPILPSPRYIKEEIIESTEDGYPQIDRVNVLLNCHLNENDIISLYPRLWSYLEEGVERGINSKYLCRHRSPWYSQETRMPAPILCTYMGRKSKNGSTFRFILNKSKAIATNVYLMMYPTPVLQGMINEDQSILDKIWCHLNNLDDRCITDVGRVYGGGLHKVEPKELASTSADFIFDIIPNFTS